MNEYVGWRAVLAASVWLAACGNTTHNEPPAAAGSAGSAGADQTPQAAAGGADHTPSCEDARFDAESGVETCGSGEHQFEHRVRAGAGCSYDAALLDACNLSGCPGPYAYCAEQDGKSVCASGCAVDADCGQYALCQCQGQGLGGRCVPSDCRSDADCRDGARCSTHREVCGMKAAYSCAVPGEQCLIDADCAPPTPFCLPIPDPDRGGWHHLCVEALPCPEQ